MISVLISTIMIIMVIINYYYLLMYCYYYLCVCGGGGAKQGTRIGCTCFNLGPRPPPGTPLDRFLQRNWGGRGATEKTLVPELGLLK